MLKNDLKHAAGLVVGYIFSPIAALCSYIPRNDKVKGPFFDGLRHGSATGICTIVGGVLFFPIGAVVGFAIGAVVGKSLAKEKKESLEKNPNITTSVKPSPTPKHKHHLPQQSKQTISSLKPSPTPKASAEIRNIKRK